MRGVAAATEEAGMEELRGKRAIQAIHQDRFTLRGMTDQRSRDLIDGRDPALAMPDSA